MTSNAHFLLFNVNPPRCWNTPVVSVTGRIQMSKTTIKQSTARNLHRRGRSRVFPFGPKRVHRAKPAGRAARQHLNLQPQVSKNYQLRPVTMLFRSCSLALAENDIGTLAVGQSDGQRTGFPVNERTPGGSQLSALKHERVLVRR